MSIYTRTGDEGQTSLAGGARVCKACARINAYGTVDELSSHIGLLVATEGVDEDGRHILETVQNDLFAVGAILANDTGSSDSLVTDGMVHRLERHIDTLSTSLPPLRTFILPGGTRAAAQSHVCRTVCRRAERCALTLRNEGEDIPPLLLAYLNRLSDLLFVLARHLNAEAGRTDTLWTPGKEETEIENNLLK